MSLTREVTLLLGTLMTTITMTEAAEGRLLELGPVASRHLGEARKVRVHLPPSYDSNSSQRYPVLYLHDGQNVFSSAGPDCCFGWGNWGLDRTADRLVMEGRMREVIMVAVDNTRSRYREYRGRIYPEQAANGRGKTTSTNAVADNTRFDVYAAFLLKELKPRIDREFRTLKTPANTGVMGSSLGGICSLSLAWEYPRTFGLAASLSGSFQIERTNFLRQVLAPAKSARKPIKIYLDSGTIDYTGDDDGRRNTEAVVQELRRLGWQEPALSQPNGPKQLLHYTDLNPLTEQELDQVGLRRDKWGEARHSQHNEFYWRLRAWRALTFLFPARS